MHTYLQRIKNVLGDQWDNHREGKALKTLCEEFLGYLQQNSKAIVEGWTAKV